MKIWTSVDKYGLLRHIFSLFPLEFSSHQEEQALVAQARTGDLVARSRLLEDCLLYVLKLATQFARLYRREFLDLVAQGNFLATKHLTVALASGGPSAYLRTKVHYGLINYCNATRTLIRTPHQGPKPIYVASLDAPKSVGEDRPLTEMLASPSYAEQAHPTEEEKPGYRALYQAIDTLLSERQRDTILRSYGLRGYAPQSLAQIAEAWYGKVTSEASRRQRQNRKATVNQFKAIALKKLRHALADVSFSPLTGNREAARKS